MGFGWLVELVVLMGFWFYGLLLDVWWVCGLVFGLCGFVGYFGFGCCLLVDWCVGGLGLVGSLGWLLCVVVLG